MSEINNTPRGAQEFNINDKTGDDLKEIVDQLHFLGTYSEEMPDKIVHSNAEDNRYKVRIAWYQGVVAVAEQVLRTVKEDSPETTEIQEGINYFTSEEFKMKGLSKTTREDMDKGNRVIELALKVVREE